MTLLSIAARVTASHESLERPGVESSVRMDISFSADFEGNISKEELTKKIESEVMAALESSIKIVSRELRLRPGRVLVKPLHIEVAMNDQASIDEEETQDG